MRAPSIASHEPPSPPRTASSSDCSSRGSKVRAARRPDTGGAGGDRRAERRTRGLDELLALPGLPGTGGDGLQDADEVADGDALGEQVAQDALHLGEGDAVAADLAGDARADGLDRVDEHLDVLAPEQVAGVPADDLGEVGDDDRRAVDHRRALGGQHLGHLLAHPGRGQAEDGVDGRAPGDAAELVGVAEHHAAAGWRLAAADLDAVHVHRVGERRQVGGVLGAHRRHDDAELARGALAQGPDPVDEVAAAGGVEQVEQVGGEVQLERLDAGAVEQRRATVSPSSAAGVGLGVAGSTFSTTARLPASSSSPHEQQERQLGHAGQQAEHER